MGSQEEVTNINPVNPIFSRANPYVKQHAAYAGYFIPAMSINIHIVMDYQYADPMASRSPDVLMREAETFMSQWIAGGNMRDNRTYVVNPLMSDYAIVIYDANVGDTIFAAIVNTRVDKHPPHGTMEYLTTDEVKSHGERLMWGCCQPVKLIKRL